MLQSSPGDSCLYLPLLLTYLHILLQANISELISTDVWKILVWCLRISWSLQDCVLQLECTFTSPNQMRYASGQAMQEPLFWFLLNCNRRWQALQMIELISEWWLLATCYHLCPLLSQTLQREIGNILVWSMLARWQVWLPSADRKISSLVHANSSHVQKTILAAVWVYFLGSGKTQSSMSCLKTGKR